MNTTTQFQPPSMFLRRSLTTTQSTPPDADGKPIIDFIASDETIDRYAEVLTPAGWHLDSYRRNPVFQNAHNYGDIIHTIGRALQTEVRADTLYQRIEFATAANPLAKIAYALYRGQFLRAVSVGFIPIRWEDGTKNTPYRRRFLEQELLEVSAVGIPANPNALALGLKSGAVDNSDLRELAQLLASLSRQPQPAHPRRATLLLQLSSELRQLLKKI